MINQDHKIITTPVGLNGGENAGTANYGISLQCNEKVHSKFHWFIGLVTEIKTRVQLQVFKVTVLEDQQRGQPTICTGINFMLESRSTEAAVSGETLEVGATRNCSQRRAFSPLIMVNRWR
jgi:hypothetical protein